MSNRSVYFYYLKIICTFLVVYIHVGANDWHDKFDKHDRSGVLYHKWLIYIRQLP